MARKTALLAFSHMLRQDNPTIVLCRVSPHATPAMNYYSGVMRMVDTLPMTHSFPDWAPSPEYFWSAVDATETASPLCWMMVASCPEENQGFLYQAFLQRIFFHRHLSFSACLNDTFIYALFSQRPVGCWSEADFFLSPRKGGSPRCHINSRSILQAYASVFGGAPSLLSVTGECKL